MTVRVVRILISVIIILIGVTTLLTPAAQAHGLRAGPPTILSILPIGTVSAGVETPVQAKLVDEYGRPIPDQPIEFYVDDVARGRILTNAAGIATYTLRTDLKPGAHVLKVNYGGGQTWGASFASAAFTVLNAGDTTLTVQPLKPLARGEAATLVARLTDGLGKPVFDEPVDLYLDTARERRAWTNLDGNLVFPLSNSMTPGNHQVKLIYSGSAKYAPTTAETTVVVLPPAPLRLTIEPMPALPMGERAVVTATLTTNRGAPIADQPLDLYVDGARDRRVWTNLAGVVSVRLSNEFQPGKHIVKFVFDGTPTLAPINATMEFLVNTPKETTLVIQPISATIVGEYVALSVKLVDADGAPVTDQPIDLYVDGTRERRVWADPTGLVSMRAAGDLAAGTHTFKAIFAGAIGLAPTTNSADFLVKPARVEIRTVPALPRIRFSLNGKVFESGADGMAYLEADTVGTYRLEVLPTDDYASDVRAEFARWGDDQFERAREVRVPTEGTLDVGFNTYYRVRLSFFDLANQPVDVSRVLSVTLKGSQGTVFPVESSITGPHWMQAGRVVRRAYGLEETKLLYSLQSVMVEGSNVVSQAQQRFYVNREDDWQIKLLLYSVRIQARDAVFDTPIGTAVRVEYPSKREEDFRLDANGEVVIRNLARGPYRFTVKGAAGNAPTTPADVSRDQDVVLKVLSLADMALGVGLMALIGFGLLFVGRPKLLIVLHPVALFRLTRQAWQNREAILARLTPLLQRAQEMWQRLAISSRIRHSASVLLKALRDRVNGSPETVKAVRGLAMSVSGKGKTVSALAAHGVSELAKAVRRLTGSVVERVKAVRNRAGHDTHDAGSVAAPARKNGSSSELKAIHPRANGTKEAMQSMTGHGVSDPSKKA